MSGFHDQWLQLREPADHRCRSAFSDAIDAGQFDRWTIVDLGAGTGSNYRFISPRFERPQEWICIDNDRELLDALASRALATAGRSVSTRQLDLAGDIGATIAAAFDNAGHGVGRLVTASALLDLVSHAWIEALAAACANAGASAWFALSYDGRIELAPQHPQDAWLQSMINAHQRTNKGFGAALGPQAHSAACAAFARRGYEVLEARSDWHLTTNEAQLQGELIEGWLSAARELAHDATALAEWSELRRSQLAAGVLEIRVGHADLLAQRRASA
jgi:SAM-dependent methyltransferase